MRSVSYKKNVKRMRLYGFIATIVIVIVIGTIGIIMNSPALAGVIGLIAVVAAIIQISPQILSDSTHNDPSKHKRASSIVNKSIFHFNMPLHNPNDFYGRQAARNTLMSRIKNGGSCSIVGERRIGKTWLLTYIQLIIVLDPNYRIGSVSMTDTLCHDVFGFVQQTIHTLKLQDIANDPSLPPLGRLTQIMQNLRNIGSRAVLCIDEFEGVVGKHEFNREFFEGLRVLADRGDLVLVTASRRPLQGVIGDLIGQTSPFFNVFQNIKLKPFMEEAQGFVQQKSVEAGFNTNEQNLFLDFSRYGYDNESGKAQYPPLRLQLAGQMLLDKKSEDQGNPVATNLQDSHVRQEFLRELEDKYNAVVGRGK